MVLLAGAGLARLAGCPVGAARCLVLGGFTLTYGTVLLAIGARQITANAVTTLHAGAAVAAAAGLTGLLAARAYASLQTDPGSGARVIGSIVASRPGRG